MSQRHHHGHDHHHDDHDHSHAGPGHNHSNSPRSTAQWQTPHQPDGAAQAAAVEPDLDQVEAAFIDGFLVAPDPVSFLRLARVPFEFTAADGKIMKLLRVEMDALTDVGSLTPHVGGGSFRYDPLPTKFISLRRKLRFIYFNGAGLQQLTFMDVRSLR